MNFLFKKSLIKMNYFTIIILTFLLIYFFILFTTYFFQRNLLYHPKENNYLDNQINFEYKEVFIPVNKNIKLKSWIIEKDFKKNKTLIFFHGNAGNLNNRIYKINELYNLDINILLVSWRGFSGNKGKPTEKGLYEDAKSTILWVKKQGVNLEDIILYGESLGTGVATQMAFDFNVAGLILESPYTSMIDAGKLYYPYLPVSFLLKDRYETSKKIDKINIPILIMHGKQDDLVPIEMSYSLFDKIKGKKYSYFPENDDHMMEYNNELIKNIENFINKLK